MAAKPAAREAAVSKEESGETMAGKFAEAELSTNDMVEERRKKEEPRERYSIPRKAIGSKMNRKGPPTSVSETSHKHGVVS